MCLKEKIKETIRHYEEQIDEEKYEIERMSKDIDYRKGVIAGYKDVVEDLKIDVELKVDIDKCCITCNWCYVDKTGDTVCTCDKSDMGCDFVDKNNICKWWEVKNENRTV